MLRPERPGGATHWDSEAGYFCKREGQKVSWWANNPQTHKREWKATEIDAENLEWNFMYEELPPR